MPGVHKEVAFEDAIEAYLLAHDWHQGNNAFYDAENAVDTSELFTFIGATQPTEWEQLVTRHGGDQDTAQAKFRKLLCQELDRRGTLDVLRRGVKDQGVPIKICFFRPAHELTAQVAERYAANRCTVCRQLRYSPETQDELDLTLMVNGIPVATAELKNPLTNQTVEHAKHQYRFDRDPKDKLLSRRALAHFAVDPDLVFMTTRLAGKATQFLPFNRGGADGSAGNPPHASGYKTAYLWEEVWQRDAWLDILHRFVHVETDENTGKRKRGGKVIFPRFHQWDVVRKVLADSKQNGAGHSYLIQHSAGSGKSNSIAWCAHQLAAVHDASNTKVFNKVIVITDRVVLDRQLQETIFQFDHTPGVVERIDKHSGQLADALRSKQAQVVITTLQKFPFVMDKVSGDLSDGRYAIIVDEAHSSQTGETAKALKNVLGAGTDDDTVVDGLSAEEAAALSAAEQEDAAAESAAEQSTDDLLLNSVSKRGRQPNLSFFAFTATPKRKTLELFGTKGNDGKPRPFHLYSMRQAIDEGFILDVLRNYVTYRQYYEVAKKAATDPDVDRSKAAAAVARFASLHPYALSQKAEVVVEHFRRVTAKKISGRAKAMVVTRSRLHAVRFKQAVDAYIAEKGYDDLKALVAFSGTVDDGGVPYTEPQMNGLSEAQLPERFEEEQQYGLLIVAEKYQTGYDQPLLHTMYVDKKLDGIKAVQTLSRLNRIHPTKEDTFVLDFANEADDIQEAFKPFFEATISEPTDPNVLWAAQSALGEFPVIHDDDVEAFTAAYLVNPNATADHGALYKRLEPAVGRFKALDEDDQDEFRSRLQSFVRLYAFLAQVIPYGDADLESLYLYGRFLALRLPRREDGSLDLSDDLRLTHLRTELTGKHNLALSEGSELEDGDGDGGGSRHEPEKAPLSSIIDQINKRFGTEFTPADQLFFDQVVEEATEDPDLKAQAKANTEENFAYGFAERFTDIVIDRRNDNEALFAKLMGDDAFADLVRGWAMTQVYEKLRAAA
jgi:type I restriction enzyme R subunit